jgi:glycyl-tRNA synthetase
MKPNKPNIAKIFKQKTQEIVTFLNESDEKTKENLWKCLEEHKKAEICIGENSYTIDYTMTAPVNSKKTITQEVFYPSVIEPSFGIGRIIYSILEHAYKERDTLEELRSYLLLPPAVAPIKCSVLPLSKNEVFDSDVEILRENIKRRGLSCEVDSSSSTIGKRYARCDEIGIPFAVTVDFQTQVDDTVTLREAEGMSQVRLPIGDVATIIRKLVDKTLIWPNVAQRYPAFFTSSS